MIPREPTAFMIAAAKAAVSGYPRDAAIIAVWQAMWDAASAGEAGTAETVKQGSVHEHAAPEGGDAQARSDAPKE